MNANLAPVSSPRVKILVTGANGFVGRSLLNHLSDAQFDIIAATRSPVHAGHRVSLTQIDDIGPNTDWSAALEGVNVVIHLAARVHRLQDYHSDRLSAYRLVNTEGTTQLAMQAAKAGVRQFIFLSSVKVYGEHSEPAQPFGPYSPLRPMDDYGLSKMEAEASLREVENTSNMKVTVIRPPLVYGPGVGANFAEMIRWISSGVPLPFGKLSNNARSMVALDNLISLIVTCVDHPKAHGQTFLVSDGRDLSTVDLVTHLSLAMGKSPRLFSVPLWFLKLMARMVGRVRAFDRLTSSLQVDISHTVDQLGWTPVMSQDEALSSTVRHRA